MTLRVLVPRNNSTIRPRNRKVAGLVFYDGMEAFRAHAVNIRTGAVVTNETLTVLGGRHLRFSFTQDIPSGNYVVFVSEKRGMATAESAFRVAGRGNWSGAGSPDIEYPKSDDVIYFSPVWACGTSPDRFDTGHPELQKMTPTDPAGNPIDSAEVIWDAEWFFARFELSVDGIYKLKVKDMHEGQNPPPPDEDEEFDIEVDL